MKSGKFLIIAILFLVSLLCLSAVSAADDAASDVIADTIDEPILEESIDDADLGDSENEELGEIDENVLNENSQTNLANSNDEDDSLGAVAVASFSYIKDEVQRHDELNFTYDVLYSKEYGDEGLEDGIPITKDCTIDGHGNTISGSNQARIFYVNGAHLTIKNLNLKNGIAEWGGAIFVYNGASLTVINCTFSNNVADVVDYSQGGLHVPEAGAILVKYNSNCNIIDSRFEGNTANVSGGALVGCYNSNINIVNSTFTNNGVINDYPADWAGGDAIIAYEGTNLVISKSTFESNNAGNAQLSAIKSSGSSVTVSDSSFSNEDGIDGGAMYGVTAINCTFNGNTADYGGAMNGGSAINCTFNGNSADEGGAMYGGSATNCTFIDNHAVDGGAMYGGSASNCDFNGNHAENGGAFCFGIASNCDFNGNYAINGSAIYNGDATDCNFTENNGIQYAGSNGAIFISDGNEATVTNCYFNNNKADYAAAISGSVTANNCIFKDNSAYFECGAMYRGTAINCTFTGNSAKQNCGAIESATAINCSFTDNFAGCTYEGQGGGAFFRGTAINCTFTGNSATRNGGAMMDVNAINCSFIANSANEGGAMYRGNAENCTFALNTASVEGTDDTSETVTGDNCKFYKPVLSASDFSTAYNYGEKFIFKLVADDQVFDGIETILSISKNGATANYTALSGEGWTVNLEPGTYIVELSIPNSDVSSIFRTITVTKNPAKITASAITATYNVNKYLTIKLTDGKGKALSGVNVTVKVGTISKTVKTNKDGQIKINVASLVPKTYTATIKYAGNAYYVAASKSVKVVVKKATPKLTAKAKTFKVNVKTKKYTITLKNNKGKVIKKAKLTLKVGKKTYKATTNSKGKATFKITKLTKKGKYTAVIKYAGNKYYKALSKKVKITVKK